MIMKILRIPLQQIWRYHSSLLATISRQNKPVLMQRPEVLMATRSSKVEGHKDSQPCWEELGVEGSEGMQAMKYIRVSGSTLKGK